MENATTPHPEWKLLFAQFNAADYGTFIPHEQIENIIGCKRSTKYYGLVNRWKTAMLKEASRQIEPVNSKGYEIVLPCAFRASAKKKMTSGHKRIRKAAEIVLNAPFALMPEDEQMKVGEMGTLITQILYFSKSTLKKVREIEKKTDQLMLDVGKALDIAD